MLRQDLTEVMVLLQSCFIHSQGVFMFICGNYCGGCIVHEPNDVAVNGCFFLGRSWMMIISQGAALNNIMRIAT